MTNEKISINDWTIEDNNVTQTIYVPSNTKTYVNDIIKNVIETQLKNKILFWQKKKPEIEPENEKLITLTEILRDDTIEDTKPANIGPQDVLRTSPKDSI